MFTFLLAETELRTQWTEPLVEAMTALWTKIAAFLPNLAGMLVILIVGYFVSKLLQKIATGVLRKARFDDGSEKVGLQNTLQKVGIRSTASEIVGKIVFWLFMLTFLISATETLGLENVSKTIDSFVAYLPNVIAAAVIVVVGLVLAHFVQNVVQAGAESIGVEYARTLGRLSYIVLLVVVGTLAIGQLGIETTLLNRIVEIVLIAAATALALALGLGTRDIARNVVAGVYARDLYKNGSEIQVDGQKGSVQSVGTVSTTIKTSEDRLVHIPNSQLTEAVVQETGKASATA